MLVEDFCSNVGFTDSNDGYSGFGIASDVMNIQDCVNCVSDCVFPNILEENKESLYRSKMTLDYLNNEGLHDMFVRTFDGIFEKAVDHFCSNGLSDNVSLTDVLSSLLSGIEQAQKNELLQRHCDSLSVDSDPQRRIFCIKILPLIADSDYVERCCRSFTLDSVAPVRVELMKVMPCAGLSNHFINYIVGNAVNDASRDVKRAAVGILTMTDCNVSIVNKFLENPDTTKAVLRVIKSVVSKYGLESIYHSLRSSLVNVTIDSAAASVINMGKYVDIKDHGLLLDLAMEVRESTAFIRHLKIFSESFQDHTRFIEILSPTGISKWRVRYELMKCAEQFIDIFHDTLIPIAEEFSNDEVACVRNGSAHLWYILIKESEVALQLALGMIDEGFQQRLVLCRIIGLLGERDGLKDITERLKNDPVPNIRDRLLLELPEGSSL